MEEKNIFLICYLDQVGKLGPYTERINLRFEPFFVKEISRLIESLREIKTDDQHCDKFLLIQQNKFFRLNVN